MRKGFILPLSLAILAIIGVLGTTMFMVSRQHLSSTRFYAERERAYQIAAGAVEIGMEATDSFLKIMNDPNVVTKNQDIPDQLKPFANAFLNQDGLLRDDVEFIMNDDPLLENLMVDGDWSVKLSVKLKKMGTLPAHNGVPQDAREAIYLFLSSAVVRGGDLATSELEVTAFKQWRTVNILLPVLGKFVLFTRGQQSQEVNELDDAMIHSNQARPLVIQAGQPLPPDEKLSPNDLKKFIEKQGWVFLGGQKWLLNLSNGWNDPEFQDAFTSKGMELYNLRPEDDYLVQMDSSKNYGFAWTRYISGLYKELSTLAQQEVLPEIDVNGSSVYNLFGSAELPFPTLVLGRVGRRSALIQGLWADASNDSAPLPFLTEAQFQNDTWPGALNSDSVPHIKQNFNYDYSEYKKQMSQVIKQPYNDGLLWIMNLGSPTTREQFIRECEARVEPIPGVESMNATILGQLRMELLEIDNVEKFLCEELDGQSFTLKNDVGKEVFKSLNLHVFKNSAHLERRSFGTFDTYANFLNNFQKDGILKLGGVTKILRSIRIENPLVIEPGGGGIVLVDGDIHIGAGIQAGAEPFSLVSLNGNIRLNTSDPVHASMVCLKGTFSFPEGSTFEVKGSVAADEIDLKAIPTTVGIAGKRSLTYNSNIDPTIFANWNAAYRVMQDRGWSYTTR